MVEEPGVGGLCRQARLAIDFPHPVSDVKRYSRQPGEGELVRVLREAFDAEALNEGRACVSIEHLVEGTDPGLGLGVEGVK